MDRDITAFYHSMRIMMQDLSVVVRAGESGVELVDDRSEPHTVRRHMFVPTSQFHLYGHVTSRDRADGDDDYDVDDVDDDEDVKELDDENDPRQLTVSCRAARDVRFYIVNVFLVLVLAARSRLSPIYSDTSQLNWTSS